MFDTILFDSLHVLGSGCLLSADQRLDIKKAESCSGREPVSSWQTSTQPRRVFQIFTSWGAAP